MSYKFVEGDTIIFNGKTLHRIVCTQYIHGKARVGEYGGYIESYGNLSRIGDAWIGYDAIVAGKAVVAGNTLITGKTTISGNVAITSHYSGFKSYTYNSPMFEYFAGSMRRHAKTVISDTIIKNNYNPGIVISNCDIKNSCIVGRGMMFSMKINNSRVKGDFNLKGKFTPNHLMSLQGISNVKLNGPDINFTRHNFELLFLLSDLKQLTQLRDDISGEGELIEELKKQGVGDVDFEFAE